MLFHSGGAEIGSERCSLFVLASTPAQCNRFDGHFCRHADLRWLRSGSAMLQPEKYEAHDRNQDIAVKNDAGVPRGEIVCRDHLIDVNAGRAPARRGRRARPAVAREPQIEASPERQQSHHCKAEAGEADLQLEWTVLPSDEARRQFPEKDMKDEIVEV